MAGSCSVVDLDVDLDTGEVLYRRYVGSTDVGKAINPVIVAAPRAVPSRRSATPHAKRSWSMTMAE